MNKPIIHILLIEDSLTDALLCREVLAADALAVFLVTTAEHLSEAVDRLAGQRFDAILLDLGLPDSQGLATFEKMQAQAPTIPIVVMAGLLDEQIAVKAVQSGAQDYLVKGPTGWDYLARAIRYAIERQQARVALDASERRFRALVENSTDAIAMVDPAGKIIYASPGYTRLLGYGEAELIGPNALSLIHPDDQASATEKLLAATRAPGNPIQIQTRQRHKDGSWHWLEGTVTNLLNDPGVGAIVANFRDITERKQADEALKNSESRFRALIKNGQDNISLLAADGTLLWESPATERMLDYKPDELIGQNMFELLHPDDLAWIQPQYAELLQEPGSLQHGSFRLRRSDGAWRWVEATVTNLLNEPSVQAIVINYRDVTARKQAENDLRQAESRYRTLVEQLPVITYVVTEPPELKTLYISPQIKDVLGFTPEEWLADPGLWQRQLHPADRERVLAEDERSQLEGGYSSEYRIHAKDGRIVWLHDEGRPVYDEQGRIRFTQGIEYDITERKRVEAALIDSNTRFRALFEASPDAIVLIDPHDNWPILDCNTAACQMNGYTRDELVGQSIDLLNLAPADLVERAEYLKQIRKGNVLRLESAHRRKDGSVFPVEISTSLITLGEREVVLGIDRDITDRKRVEEQLVLSDKILRTVQALILVADINGQIVYANPAFETILGYAPGELLGDGWWQLSRPIPAEREPEQNYVRQAAAGEIPVESTPYERRVTGRHGGQRWILWYDTPGPGQTLIGVGHDVTERKRAEETLLESERQMRALVTSLDDIVFECDEEGTYLSVWAANESLLAEPRAALLSRRISDNLGEEAARPFNESIRRVLATGQVETIEYSLMLESGLHWFLARINPIRSADGPSRTVSMLVRDITERKQAEAALHDSEERFRLFMDNSPTISWMKDEQGRHVYLSKTFENRHQVSLENWRGKTDFEVWPRETAEQFWRNDQLVLESAKPLETTEETTEPDGRRVIWWNYKFLLHDAAGRRYVAGIGLDITARRRAEDSLRDSEKRFRALIENSADAIALTDGAGKILYATPGYTRILGYSEAELMGLNAFSLIHPDDLANAAQSLSATINTSGITMGAQARQRHKDGSWHWLEGSVTNLLEEPGVGAIVVNFRDITERKQAEEEVRTLNAELERRVAERTADLSRANAGLAQAVRAKDEFLASMSHELRTPLNAILTLAESLEEGIYEPLQDRQIGPLRTIAESGQHLLNLINDILDLSKIEAGKLELQVGPVEVEAVCQASLRLVRQQAQQKQLQVSLSIDSAVTLIQADARRLKQILVNLLSNAVKFTPQAGQIGLEVHGNADAGAAQFTVWDTGIGLAPEEVGRLFQPFVQIDSGLNRQYSGTGLGLSLVYRLTQLHGGSVSLVSAPNQGSRFTIALPWTRQTDARATRPLPPISVPNVQRALVVEDSPSAAEQMARYLSELGAQVTVYPAGNSALNQALQVQPEVIFLDIQLPGLSGWEVLQKLKEDERTRAIPVIMVTVVDERTRGMTLGAADYIVKPVTRQRLREALGNALTPPTAANGDWPADRTTYVPAILIAEDNPANQTIYADYLSAKGYRVSLAANGAEALERARDSQPDLIVMDIQMPGMDGLEATRRLRADPELRTIPIIAITALAMPGDRERCLAAGVNDYLAKPVSLKQLAQTIAEHLPGGSP